MGQPVRLGDAAQQPGGDDGAGQDPGPGEGGELGRLLAQERPDLVAREPAPPAGGVRVGDGDRAAVRVRVVGEHEVGAGLARQRQGQVQGAGLLGVGRVDGGEVRVGLELLGDDDDVVETGAHERLAADAPAHPVQGGEHDPQGGGRRRAGGAHGGVEVLLDHVGADGPPAGGGHGHPRRRPDGGDAPGDLLVVGRDDLGAPARAGHGPPAQVHLVPVVLRRVVRGGHHDPGVGPQAAQREGQHRGGAALVEQEGVPAGPGHHAGGVTGEDGRSVPRVVADDDGEALAQPLTQPGAQARGGPDDDGAVHPVRPGAQAAPQPRRAEPEGPGEGVGQLGRGRRVAGPVGGQEAAQLLARAGVGIPGDPGGHGLGVEGRRNGAGSVEAVLGGLSHARDGTVRNRP